MESAAFFDEGFMIPTGSHKNSKNKRNETLYNLVGTLNKSITPNSVWINVKVATRRKQDDNKTQAFNHNDRCNSRIGFYIIDKCRLAP